MVVLVSSRAKASRFDTGNGAGCRCQYPLENFVANLFPARAPTKNPCHPLGVIVVELKRRPSGCDNVLVILCFILYLYSLDLLCNRVSSLPCINGRKASFEIEQLNISTVPGHKSGAGPNKARRRKT